MGRIRTALRARFAGSGFEGTGNIVNLSEQGLFVRTPQVPPPGQAVRLSFSAPGLGRIAVRGLVWWTTADSPGGRHQPPGFGMRLLDEFEAYGRLIENLRR